MRQKNSPDNMTGLLLVYVLENLKRIILFYDFHDLLFCSLIN